MVWMSRGVEKVELTGQYSWSIFLLGWGGIFAVMGMKRYGRLPVLFWSQVGLHTVWLDMSLMTLAQ